MTQIITIERHIADQQKKFPAATGIFTSILQDVALAGKIISRETNRAGLTDFLGASESKNVYGERQQKLDLFADSVIRNMNDHTGRLCAMVSEEHEEIIPIPEQFEAGRYILLYDPLDGSSNIDVNISIGTIFSIFRKVSKTEGAKMEDVLQPGYRLAAAGYIIYGSSTMMVYSAGQGVHGFTLDGGVGEFCLSHPDIKIPNKASYYSVNQGNEKYWTPGVRNYVKWLQGIYGEGSKPISHRYTGSMVADFHRNLLRGGVFLYPGDIEDAAKPYGKLRLMIESQSLAFIAQQAGGYASDGLGNILDIQPHTLQQLTPVFIGNRDLVEKAEQFIQEHDQEWIEAYRPYREKAPEFA